MYVAQAVPHLEAWVDCVWCLTAAAEESWDEVAPADLCSDLVLSVGEPFAVGRSSVRTESCWLGPRKAPLAFHHSSGNRLFGVRFKPGGAAAFLGVDARDLVAVEAAGGASRPWARLLARMASAADRRGERGGPLAPMQRALAGVSPARDNVGFGLLQRLSQHVVAPPIPSFAKSTGLTERSLQRYCARTLGVGPKAVQRIQRAQRARRLVDAGHSGSTVAQRLGFYDQAHLINELKALLGATPSTPNFQPSVCRLSPSQS